MGWIDALGIANELVGTIASIAVIFGVFIGFRQLNMWRSQRVAMQKADLAENLIAHLSELQLAISDIRSPVEHSAPPDEVDVEAYDFKRRIKALANLDAEYLELRKLKVRQRLLIGDDEINQRIEEYFDARRKLFVALAGVIRAYKSGTERGQRNDAAYTKRIPKYLDIIWEGSDDPDEIQTILTAALDQIEKKLIPVARMRS